MPSNENPGSPFATTIPTGIIVAYAKDVEDGAESGRGEVIGVITRAPGADTGVRRQLIHAGADSEQFLWTGFTIELHADAAESYYFNLMGERPSVFVVSRLEHERFRPFLVTCSYDEADAYMEVDEWVSAVTMPPEIYRSCEAFVLAHYVPEKKRKRKRDDWKKQGPRP